MLSVDHIFNVRYLLVEGASITFRIIRSKIYHDHNINWWGGGEGYQHIFWNH